MLNRRPTGNRFHQYLNPEREIDAGAIEVHGITNAMLADKPKFADIAADLSGICAGRRAGHSQRAVRYRFH